MASGVRSAGAPRVVRRVGRGKMPNGLDQGPSGHPWTAPRRIAPNDDVRVSPGLNTPGRPSTEFGQLPDRNLGPDAAVRSPFIDGSSIMPIVAFSMLIRPSGGFSTSAGSVRSLPRRRGTRSWRTALLAIPSSRPIQRGSACRRRVRSGGR